MKNEMRDFAIRDIGCIYCRMAGIEGWTPCEKHHLNAGDKAGGERVGEKATVGACQWHHVGKCYHTQSIRYCDTCTRLYGPSMKHNKRDFMERFGSGTEQLAYQDNLISNWCNPRATFPGLSP
jgi:hypothetical protein